MTSRSAAGSLRPPANPLFWLAGLPFFPAGIGLIGYGGLRIYDFAQQFLNASHQPPPIDTPGQLPDIDSLAPPADFSIFTGGFALICWGAVAVTAGRYLWRGARTRGMRDRAGRLILLVALGLLGIALQTACDQLATIWQVRSEDEAQAFAISFLTSTMVWGVPSGLLSIVGMRLAREEQLITAGAGASLS